MWILILTNTVEFLLVGIAQLNTFLLNILKNLNELQKWIFQFVDSMYFLSYKMWYI